MEQILESDFKKMNADLKAKLQSVDEQYEALLRDEQHRATYLLATMIVDPLEPERSIAGTRPLVRRSSD